MSTLKKPEVKATATIWFLINCGKRGGSSEGLIEATHWTEDECKSAAISLGLGQDYETGVGQMGHKEEKFEYFDGVEAASIIVKNVYEDDEGQIRFDGDEHNTFDAVYAHTYPDLSTVEGFHARAILLRDDLRKFIESNKDKFPKVDTESALRCARSNMDHTALLLSEVRKDYGHE